MGVVFVIVMVFVAIASYKYLSSDNEVGPNLITAFVGVVISALVTLVLLKGQTKDEEEKERNLNLYKAKLKVYSDYVSEMYAALSDNHVTSEELTDLRTKLFSSIGFYAGENALVDINKLILKYFFDEKEKFKKDIDIDNKMSILFSGITNILQKDTKTGKSNIENNNTEDIVQILWRNFEEIIKSLIEQEKQEEELNKKEQREEQRKKDILMNQQDEVEKNIENELSNNNDEDKYLKQQAWHFNALGDEQFKRIEENLDESKEIELSLVEYGEYWRTNLLKQVGKGDIIMLFRRGGYGYVGAFKAVGRRIFDFEKGEEEILYFKEPEKSSFVTTKDNNKKFEEDAVIYDIYKSKEDGATLCSNLIVKRIAYVPDGVGNPGGVYRKTISRYDSHYAELLQERFQKKGQW